MNKTRHIWTLTLTALLLAACSATDIESDGDNYTPSDIPIAFDAEATGYKGIETRSSSDNGGYKGPIVDLSTIQDADKGDGFGVLAHYSGSSNYASSYPAPNFMYNQQVTYNSTSGTWEYDPVKYWPNNDGDKISFFAYTPYTKLDESSHIKGGNSYGIAAITSNSLSGSWPNIRWQLGYYPYGWSTGTEKTHDLCWGVNPDTGLPYTDQTKQTIDETDRIKFKFIHALSRVAFSVQKDYDEEISGVTVTVRYLRIEGNFPVRANLILCNDVANTAYWYYYTDLNANGQADAGEVGVAQDTTMVKNEEGNMVVGTTKPYVRGWTMPSDITVEKGDENRKNVFTGTTPITLTTSSTYEDKDNKAKEYFLIIPTERFGSVDYTIYVQYFITHADGTVMENYVKKTVSLNLKCNTQYEIKLKIGLDKLTIDGITVSDWDDVTGTTITLDDNGVVMN